MARIGAASVDWHGGEVLATVERAVVDALNASGEALVKKYKGLLSVPFPPASRPGQPPHKRSGGLQKAQTHRVVRDGAGASLIVGVPASSPVSAQARALADGTSRMRARPWINEDEVRAAGVLAEAMVGQEVAARL